MNKNDQILLFLGRIQARIEDLEQWAFENSSPIISLLTEFEVYFNKSMQDIFSENDKINDIKWTKGIKWNSLPR